MNTLETMKARRARQRQSYRQSDGVPKPHLVAEALAKKQETAPAEIAAKSIRQREDAAINRAKATKRGAPWTAEELAVVANYDLTAREVSEILGRSMCAVHHQRKNQ